MNNTVNLQSGNSVNSAVISNLFYEFFFRGLSVGSRGSLLNLLKVRWNTEMYQIFSVLWNPLNSSLWRCVLFAGAQKEGAAGFFKGVGKGLVGAVARPTGGIIDMASSTFQGIKRYSDLFLFLSQPFCLNVHVNDAIDTHLL